MSQPGATPMSESSGTAIGSPRHSNKEKYPVFTEQQSYPEVAVPMNQPSLEHFQQPTQQYQQPNNQNYAATNQYQYAQTPGPAQQEFAPQEQQKRNPWGMSPLAFGLLVALITALVVGGAVGGGVAGAMSSKDDDSSSNSPISTVTVTRDAAGETASATATTTDATSSTSGVIEPSSLKSFSAPEPYYVDTLEDPGCQNSRINVQYDERYDLSCGLNFGNGRADLDDDTKIVADFVGIFAYSITDCLYACTNANYFTKKYNEDHEGGDMQLCKAVTWAYDMALNNETNFANCWLKNGTSAGTQCNTCISAVLV